MAESLNRRPALASLAAVAALAGAPAIPALLVDAKPARHAQMDESVTAADSGARLAAVMRRPHRPRYQLQLDAARDPLGTSAAGVRR